MLVLLKKSCWKATIAYRMVTAVKASMQNNHDGCVCFCYYKYWSYSIPVMFKPNYRILVAYACWKFICSLMSKFILNLFKY